VNGVSSTYRRLTGITYPSGKQVKYIYDKTRLDRIVTPESSIDYSYLCSSKVGSITDGTNSVAYGYDSTLVTSESLAGTLNQSLTYAYNNDFNVTTFSYAGSSVNYTYDNDGLLTGAGNFTITRNSENGLPQSVSDGNLAVNRTFNGYGEVATQSVSVNSAAPLSWNLTRDNSGRITSKTETVNGVSSTYVYTYDTMGRLLTATKDLVPVEEYQYSANGTRIHEHNTLRNVTRDLTYSDEEHLLTVSDIQTEDTTSYQYEFDGFRLSKTDSSGTTQYTYSTLGELLKVILPDGRVIEYTYDPMQRRVAKKINGAVVEKYLWQGLTRLLAVYDGSDNLIMRFEYADGRMPVAMTAGDSRYYLVFDQVGSLRVITDSSGNLVKQIDYDSFGNILSETGSLALSVPFGFAGGLHDRDTGLVKFGYRDYDPDNGRWCAKDPIGFGGGDTDLFGYCMNDPVNLVDPTGEFALLGAIIGGAIDLATQLVVGDEVNVVSIGVSALAGAAGVGLGNAVNKLVTGFLSRAILNSIGSAFMSAGIKHLQNIIEGDPCAGGVFDSAILGGILGGAGYSAGSLIEASLLSKIWGNMSLKQKLLVYSNAIMLTENHRTSYAVGIANAISNIISNSGPVVNAAGSDSAN